MDAGVKSEISGVEITPLKQIEDHRGAVLHMLRVDSPVFQQFGEVYFSEVNPGKIKAWKRHRKITQNINLPIGRLKLVLFDNRLDSPSAGKLEIHILGRPDNYYLITIPPMIWYGFQCISAMSALIVNCANLPHDPDESEIADLNTANIPFSWE